jgi:hypothetical protein
MLYLEYQSVCPFVRIGSPSPFPASECAPRPGIKGGGGGQILACGWGGWGKQFKRLERKLGTLCTLASLHIGLVQYTRSSNINISGKVFHTSFDFDLDPVCAEFIQRRLGITNIVSPEDFFLKLKKFLEPWPKYPLLQALKRRKSRSLFCTTVIAVPLRKTNIIFYIGFSVFTKSTIHAAQIFLSDRNLQNGLVRIAKLKCSKKVWSFALIILKYLKRPFLL